MIHYTAALFLAQMFQWHEGGHMSMYWGFWVFWVALFLVLAWIAIGGARQAGQGMPPDRPKESVEETLRRRFAEGEIDEDEFKRRLETLKNSRG